MLKKHKKNRKRELPAWVEKWLLPFLIDLIVGVLTALIVKLLRIY